MDIEEVVGDIAGDFVIFGKDGIGRAVGLGEWFEVINEICGSFSDFGVIGFECGCNRWEGTLAHCFEEGG